MADQVVRCAACGAEIPAETEEGKAPARCPECGEALAAAPAPGAASTGGARRSRIARPERLPSANPSLALFGAIGGALLGALIWGGITYATNYEVGWVAWGIGGLVGGGCVWLGGRGQNMAVACGVLALVAIFLGKVIGTQFAVGHAIDQMVGEQMTDAMYDETRHDWTEFAKLDEPVSDERLRQYMVEHRFTESASPAEVAAAELASFRAETAPYLRRMAAENPSIEQWRDMAVEDTWSQVDILTAVAENLEFVDILFAFLGISTAFGLVMAASQREATARNRAARAAR